MKTSPDLSRLPDWRLRFDALITDRLRAPFAWGSNDCVLFAADNVLAITGVDLADGFRAHTNARGAAKALRRHGGLAALVERALGPSCHATAATQGDVVMVLMGAGMGDGVGDGMGEASDTGFATRSALGVCLNPQSAIGPGVDGLLQIPMARALCAWKVG